MAKAGSPHERIVSIGLPALLVLTILVYRSVANLGFLLLDDPEYVVRNAHVAAGLRLATVGWAFRSTEAANWHPLTWLSHALDVRLFGLWAGGHHLTNLALHVLNVALVFFALRALTGAAGRSLGVAAVFALHPMNVETVAWIAERKNLLSGTFFAATLLAYSSYARRPTRGRYATVTLLLTAGLLCKPMLVTVPFVLGLLDVWPLGRWSREAANGLVVEKLPWLALSAASSIVTLYAQSSGGAVVALQEHGVVPRLCVATTGYFEYFRTVFWPVNMAIFVPSPRLPCTELPVRTALVTLILLAIAVAFLARRQRPVVIGVAWFVGMLVPVCGLVQVGAQLTANRYMYHPIIGLALAVVFGAASLVPPRRARLATLAFGLVCAMLGWLTTLELTYWRTGEALFRRTLDVTGPNCGAELQLGVALRDRGDRAGATAHWQRAVDLCPELGEAHAHLGAQLANEGDLDRAIPHFAMAADLLPELAADMRYNLALALLRKGRRPEAIRELRNVLVLNPRHALAADLLRQVQPDGR